MYWRQRLAALPHPRRADRREAQEMITRWKQRVETAERARYGPGLLEQALTALNVRWRPHPRRLITGLTIAAAIALTLLIALVVAIVVFWSDQTTPSSPPPTEAAPHVLDDLHRNVTPPQEVPKAPKARQRDHQCEQMLVGASVRARPRHVVYGRGHQGELPCRDQPPGTPRTPTS